MSVFGRNLENGSTRFRANEDTYDAFHLATLVLSVTSLFFRVLERSLSLHTHLSSYDLLFSLCLATLFGQWHSFVYGSPDTHFNLHCIRIGSSEKIYTLFPLIFRCK